MENKNFLSKLWSSVAGSQRNDVEFDRRLTVGSPSGFTINWTLKLVSVLVLVLTIGSGNAWGQTTTTYTFTSKSWGAKIGSTTANWTSGKDGNAFLSSTPAGLQITTGSSGANGTSPKSFTNVTSVVITYNSSSKGVGNFKVKIGSNAESSALTISKSQSNQTLTFTPASAQSGSIKITGTCTTNSFSIVSVAITEAAAATTVTASPASITFDAATLDPEEGAEGSKNVTITLTNGNIGYPGGSSCYLNGWCETDETDCEFYVNSGYSYQKTTSTTSETLSLSYYATDAGTFSGNFIIQGFNASHVAVNCTIPLSVTVTAPACDKSVTISKGAETNCSFTLSKSGAQASCSGVSTTVTVTPNTGYGTPNVTQSGASASPTITGSGTSWTVSYPSNTTGTSTISVSCSALQTTVSFNQNGGEGGQTSTKTATYGLAMPTPITTPTRTGYTFEGYYDGSGGTGNKYYNADGSSAANWNKEVATATLYAKWTANKYTVTWSVNGSTYTTTANVSYNTTASTPANPSVPGECTGSTFMGWTATENYSNASSAPGDLFNGTSPTITGDITFYAVFADEE